jgi:hypothetical protein
MHLEQAFIKHTGNSARPLAVGGFKITVLASTEELSPKVGDGLIFQAAVAA